jgi:sigma-B regulation protein RsbU (phosphoserine phosphatase)
MNYWIESHGRNGTTNDGDFCDCIEIASGRYAMIIGDVAGHDADVREATRLLHAFINTVGTRIPLATGIKAADTFFTQSIRSENIPFASVFVALFDLRSGVLRYASAGHEPALLFAADGSYEELEPTGSVLGVDYVAPCRERVLRLFHENLLVLVTDGITESRRRGSGGYEFFGTGGVAAAVRLGLRDKRDLAWAVYAAAVRHANAARTDDASIVVSHLITASPSCPVPALLGVC